MQKVSFESNLYPLFSDITYLYQALSVRKSQNNGSLLKKRVNVCLQPIARLFERYSDLQPELEYNELPVVKPKIPRSRKKVLLAFSGGKDSTATAIKLREEGYQVTLYHLRGINQTYKDEYKNAEKVAVALNMPLVVESCKLSGSHEWVEHPMKNMVIAVSMLQYGISSGLTKKIAFGNFSTSTLQQDPFEVCGGDCKEAWQAFLQAVRPMIPGLEIITPLSCMKDTLDILMQHVDIAILCQSCIGPYRYRNYLHDRNVTKYGVPLPENRCGSCWKCCVEYIVYADNGIYPYDGNFYKHCLKILQDTLYKEERIRYNIDDTWNHYFFYDQSKSKYFQDHGLQV